MNNNYYCQIITSASFSSMGLFVYNQKDVYRSVSRDEKVPRENKNETSKSVYLRNNILRFREEKNINIKLHIRI